MIQAEESGILPGEGVGAIAGELGATGTAKYSLSGPLVWLAINLDKKLETSGLQGTFQQHCVKSSRIIQGVGLTLASPSCSFHALSLPFCHPFLAVLCLIACPECHASDAASAGVCGAML